jgi:hypothetical protein
MAKNSASAKAPKRKQPEVTEAEAARRAEMARRIQFGVRVAPETLKHLRTVALEENCSITDLVCKAILKLLGPPPDNIRPAVVRSRGTGGSNRSVATA